ncbi:MAG: dihydrodipicolinate synthase family protein [Alphaproteobacteria bacterium]
MTVVRLPTAGGGVEDYRPGPASPYPATAAGAFPRTVYAAAHVVADPRSAAPPWQAAAVDWDTTMAFRRHLWGLGLKVAEAMDTSQRGMGFDWPTALELIRRSVAEARTIPGADLACGAGTDHLDPSPVLSLADVTAAYEQQVAAVEQAGGRIILMASRALAACARGPDDYLQVYGRILEQAREPVILHWLGAMFDPALAGYWGSDDVDAAMATCLRLIEGHTGKVEGIKVSLLEARHEIAMRRRLPAGVKMYTGDDFNYAELIAGDEHGHSHALLGIFDTIAQAASAAMTRLAAGDIAAYRAILDPTVPLSRKVFEAPTQYYKAGVVLVAWLNGLQDHFVMVGGMQSARTAQHYADVFRLADTARILTDPDRAARRMATLMTLHGID